ncbi:MAG: hypothetical protein RIR00_296 [Pseudomonadota bacterium]|jgi:alanine racemase
MTLARPIRVRITRARLLHNHAIARQHAAGGKLWSVIKANAYGHGEFRVARTLDPVTDGLALLETETALKLREHGVTRPMLLLEGLFERREVALLGPQQLTPVVHHREQLEWLLEGRRHGLVSDRQEIYIKVNTGMNRLGFRPEALPEVRQALAAAGLQRLVLMSHFADADGPGGVAAQQAVFHRCLADWPLPCSLANSAALLGHPQALGDWVRPGIMLYGASPFADRSAAALGLQPVMALDSRIIAVQDLQPGERVGYGGLFVAERPLRVGIVACGYADGYPRHAPSGTPLAVAGQRTRTLGRVSMDMLACDLSAIPQAGIGSPVTLWGDGEGGMVPADEVAAAAGTIAYELFCAVAPRVPVVEL